MACSCKHNSEAIHDGYRVIEDLRELFIKRMTVDSETQDARRRDFNQAIFGYRDDGSTYQAWSEIDLDMVLQCFDKAVKDWRRTFCDEEGCRGK